MDAAGQPVSFDAGACEAGVSRSLLSMLGEPDTLGAAPGGRRILKAMRHPPALSRRRVKDRPLLPREVDAELVPAMWKRAAFPSAKLPQGAVGRDVYVVHVLEQLHRALRDVFAAPSNRWADPRARLLDGPQWEAMRADVLAGLSLTEDGGDHLAQLARGRMRHGGRWPTGFRRPATTRKWRSSSPDGGRARLSVDKLGAVGEPESLTWLKTTAEAILPRMDVRYRVLCGALRACFSVVLASIDGMPAPPYCQRSPSVVGAGPPVAAHAPRGWSGTFSSASSVL
ncbi:hypothetical protein [Streptomyces sp. NPDC051636]|uniref:hypothetical protein n=1 Tax=Streptomyces sp. NPDC051636 TaxID=3365663 RepID=UPI0037AA7315